MIVFMGISSCFEAQPKIWHTSQYMASSPLHPSRLQDTILLLVTPFELIIFLSIGYRPPHHRAPIIYQGVYDPFCSA